MDRIRTVYGVCLVFAVLLVGFATLNASETRKNPLDGMAWMIGGEWRSGNTVQVYEWGIDKLTVRAQSFRVSEGEKTLVSEGYWYWHPEKKVIKGFFTAKGMPFYMIESEAEFLGKKLIHRLMTYSRDGKSQKYVEVMESVSEKKYTWMLFMGSDPSGNAIMRDAFQRK
jgi:hypothetical protein